MPLTHGVTFLRWHFYRRLLRNAHANRTTSRLSPDSLLSSGLKHQDLNSQCNKIIHDTSSLGAEASKCLQFSVSNPWPALQIACTDNTLHFGVDSLAAEGTPLN